MKQVIRKGLKEIIVDEVADPMPASNHVLVCPFYSLISPGTETADIHTDTIIKEVADNPSHLKTVWNAMMKTDPVSTLHEVRAKFKDYAVLGYSGAGIVIEKDARVTVYYRDEDGQPTAHRVVVKPAKGGSSSGRAAGSGTATRSGR